jgi:hypothetical protein
VGGLLLNKGEGPREGHGPWGCTSAKWCIRQASDQMSGPWLELGIDSFNALNRVNFKNFVGIQSSPFFGRANTATPARQLQISMKLHF